MNIWGAMRNARWQAKPKARRSEPQPPPADTEADTEAEDWQSLLRHRTPAIFNGRMLLEPPDWSGYDDDAPEPDQWQARRIQQRGIEIADDRQISAAEFAVIWVHEEDREPPMTGSELAAMYERVRLEMRRARRRARGGK